MEQVNFGKNREEAIKPIKNEEEYGYGEMGIERLIKNQEFRGLRPEEIADKIYSIFRKIQDDKLIELDAKDKFIIKDKISIVNNLSVDVGGPRDFSFTLEIDGTLDELESKYKKALEEKIKELGLETDLFYALYNWEHRFSIYDKNEEVVDDDTPFKVDGRGGCLILDGQSNR
jgi:hypothetical protein